MTQGKGDKRRPHQVSEDELEANWRNTFNNQPNNESTYRPKPEIPVRVDELSFDNWQINGEFIQ